MWSAVKQAMKRVMKHESVGIVQLVERWSLDTEDPGLNPSAATELFGCFLEQDTLQTLLLSTQVYKWVPVRDVCQCTSGVNVEVGWTFIESG